MHDAMQQAIRQALASEAFGTAQRLWEEYAATVRQEIEAGTATAAGMAEMRELVEWSRLVTLSFRAHAAGRLSQSHAARAYSGG
ncbi:MAG: hypothetical protein ABI759_31845 [Candidatus Solibacter sp.]